MAVEKNQIRRRRVDCSFGALRICSLHDFDDLEIREVLVAFELPRDAFALHVLVLNDQNRDVGLYFLCFIIDFLHLNSSNCELWLVSTSVSGTVIPTGLFSVHAELSNFTKMASAHTIETSCPFSSQSWRQLAAILFGCPYAARVSVVQPQHRSSA